MKKYALLLACLAWSFGTDLHAQTAGAGAAGGGAASGAAGGGGTVIGGGAATAPGVATPPPTAPGAFQRPAAPTVPGPAGVGTAGRAGTTTGTGADTGAIGGVGPGTGALGGTGLGVGAPTGTEAGTGAIGGVPQPGAGTTEDLQTGVTGMRGPATPGAIPGSTQLPVGVTTQPGIGIGQTGTGTAADMVLAQRIRAELLNVGTGAGTATSQPALPGARGVRVINPQSLANVQINANNGTVTLLGSVPTPAERQLVENRIRRVPGVRNVANNLTVGSPGAQTFRGQGMPGSTGVGTSAAPGGVVNQTGNTSGVR